MKDKDLDPIIELLTPKASPAVPEGIKTNVLNKIKRRDALKNFFTMKNTISRIVASTAAVAAAVVVAVVFATVKPAEVRAAAQVEAIFDRSISAAEEAIEKGGEGMQITIFVRTDPNENFAYIEPSLPLVEHSLLVVRGEQLRWRLEKPGRTVVFNGTEKYMWNKDEAIGYKGDESTNFEEWFDILLDPYMVSMQEKTALQEGVKYRVEENVPEERILLDGTRDADAGEFILTADVKARGDFRNPYLRNTSIEESDTRRELRFNRETGLFHSMKIFAKVAGKEILIVEVKSRYYFTNATINANLWALPEDIEWRDVTTTPAAGSGRFAGISAEEAARLLADAINAGDLEPVREAFAYYDMARLGERFAGARVLKIGKPFRSGLYPGVFVPFKVRTGNGKVEKMNLALRNDNQGKTWLVDGGI